MAKISVIGAGNVGATAAFIMAQKGLGDIVLVDIAEGIPQGKAIDMQQCLALSGIPGSVRGTNDYAEIAGSDIVIVTAGVPRKPGMSREDLLGINSSIITSVCREIRRHAPKSVVIVITNPLDAMAYLAFRTLEFPRNRVMGMAGVLDSARLRAFISQETGANPAEVEAMVLGSHGDTMVPLLEYTTISGKPITGILDSQTIGRLLERTRKGGEEIVSHLKTGSAFYGPGASIAEMAEAILTDSGRVLPVTAYLEGEYGLSGLFIGVPASLGRTGIRSIVELRLDRETAQALRESAEHIRKSMAGVR